MILCWSSEVIREQVQIQSLTFCPEKNHLVLETTKSRVPDFFLPNFTKLLKIFVAYDPCGRQIVLKTFYSPRRIILSSLPTTTESKLDDMDNTCIRQWTVVIWGNVKSFCGENKVVTRWSSSPTTDNNGYHSSRILWQMIKFYKSNMFVYDI